MNLERPPQSFVANHYYIQTDLTELPLFAPTIALHEGDSSFLQVHMRATYWKEA